MESTIVPGAQPAGSRPGGGSVVFDASPGPWGKLKCFYIFIEAPKSMVDDYPLPFSKPRWIFPESQLQALPALFQKAGLPEAVSKVLLAPGNVKTDGDMVTIFPPVPDVEAMSQAAREVIYPELAKYQANEFYAEPVLMTTDTVEEWFRSSKLRPELIAKISKLAWHRGECLAFSDLQLMMGYAADDAEARAIFKAFTRTRSLMVQMELDEHTNLQPLLDYWTIGSGFRRKDIEPIMQSIIDTEGVDRLGITHILPALPRKLLYTYPGSEYARLGMLPDCHWTSLNFFNYDPHQYLLDARLATSSVLENFEPVPAPYRYGDVLFFVDSVQGDAFHSCVYLADDMVFTKNGRNSFSPWVIMKLSDVKKIYIYNRNGRVQGYRHKKATAKFGDQ
ncbi:MAG: hypothetical protein K1X78_27505 [Verrucomicrobiaceae bacterium]|nr:hypothetical protein [Verrucomicrobiaceae bacterium]